MKRTPKVRPKLLGCSSVVAGSFIYFIKVLFQKLSHNLKAGTRPSLIMISDLKGGCTITFIFPLKEGIA